ncbi:MAG: acyl-CoA thioesterase [Lachnospiraceae bacterium]|jgi:acyl-CoA thioester hydrolase, YbgC/YbaW family|nr:acyl-CoA thioesterase [Lachnospiraceae bacterium]
MHTYIHRVNYYETDKMGITHHSNYIRWMEEARADYLKSLGYGLRRLEADGITSPVVSVECRYKHTTTFDDEIKIEVAIEKYNSVKLELSYIMTELVTGTVVLTAKSAHCFIDEKGKPIIVKRLFPAFDEILRREKDSE